MKWFDDKYLVTAVATIIFLLLIITLVLIKNSPHCEICGCVRFAKDCHSFCKPFGHEMSAVCQHVCVRPR